MSNAIKKIFLLIGCYTILCPGFSYSLPEHYSNVIQELVKNNPCQLSVTEYSLIAEVLFKKSPCNMLVFGVGNDSEMWIDLNKGGMTFFVEDNANWLQDIHNKIPHINACVFTYGTQRYQWKDLIKTNFSHLLHMNLPQIVLETKWDIIFVDGPAGYSDVTPGRMKSIYMASYLSHQNNNNTDVFVHDADREVESLYSSVFLYDVNLKQAVDRLRYYIIP